MPELIPTHAHTWPAANALAFRAAVMHLSKIGMKVGGSTDGKFLYQLIMTQLNVARDEADMSQLQHDMQHNTTVNPSTVQAMKNLFNEMNIAATVSYTHLTLPTIYSV